MIPTKFLIPLVVLLVIIAYQYIGEAAIAGLLAMFLGKKPPPEIKHERDEHEELMEQAETSAAIHHDKAQALADDITQPKEPVKPGKTRKRFGTST